MKVQNPTRLYTNIPQTTKGFLIFGNDANGIEFRSQFLTLLLKKQRDFEVQWEDADFSQLSPPSMGLFATEQKPKLHMAQELTDKSLKHFAEKIENPEWQNCLLLSSSKLTTSSKMVKHFVAASNLYALPTYEISLDELAFAASAVLKFHNIQIAPNLARNLAEYYSTTPHQFLSEVEKLTLLCYPETTITQEHLETSTTLLEGGKVFDLVNALLVKDTVQALKHLKKINIETEAIFAVRVILNAFSNLFKLKNRAEDRVPPAQLFNGFRPPIHFAQKPLFQQAIQKWSLPHLTQTLSNILTLEKILKSQPQNMQRQFEQLLLDIK